MHSARNLAAAGVAAEAAMSGETASAVSARSVTAAMLRPEGYSQEKGEGR
jgi:hypothetical protein